jgi:steroid delta-isomerase-like uncharacterized protein
VSDHAAIVRRFYEAVWTEGRLETASAFLANDLIDHNALQFPGRADGAAGLLQVVAMIRSALPDLTRTVEDQVEQGDRVATRFIDQGTHRGELLGVAPTGRVIRLEGINIERVLDGRIVEVWHVEDLFGLLQQIGPRPESAAG